MMISGVSKWVQLLPGLSREDASCVFFSNLEAIYSARHVGISMISSVD